MLSENSVIKGRSGLIYKLGKEIGNGGEGAVYLVQNRPSLAIKIYKKNIDRQEEKLHYMVKHPIPELQNAYGVPIIRIAWPYDVVYDETGRFVGYAMPFVDGGIEIFEIHRCCTSPKARKVFPNYNWMLNVIVAQNLAVAVDYLHRYRCVIGDMNCKNILVDKNGSIIFLDVDSFDITDSITGAHYKCTVGTEDYLAPELQGRDLRKANAKFTVHTDDFALAIHIFQLLMDNYHPFSCLRREQMKDSVNQNQRLEQIGSGSCPFVKKHEGLDVPPGAPIIQDILPAYLASDFAATFDYNESNVVARITERTTAAVWVKDLEKLRNECANGGLVVCRNNPRHWYLNSIGYCGHCKAQERLKAHLSREKNNTVETNPSQEQMVQTNTYNTTNNGKKAQNASDSSGCIVTIIGYALGFSLSVFVILPILRVLSELVVDILQSEAFIGLLAWAVIIFFSWKIVKKNKK